MRSIKIVSLLLTSLFSSVVFADTSDNARDTLPACDSAKIAIFNGAQFDGVLYLHETDIKLTRGQTAAVHAMAEIGTPAVCEDGGAVVVTLAQE